jgi:flagellar basal-body rod modification protein FlgD
MAIHPLSSNTTDVTAPAVTNNDAGSADRFLKLLVAQMQNQDPLNPMDNAQVTSQMAQINTVSGIEKLNKTVEGLSGQFVQLQALQGASLVGRDVVVQGDRLTIEAGVGQGGFELNAPADQVKVEVLDASGRVIDTLNLGASGTGRHGFNWPAASTAAQAAQRFRVSATIGSTAVSATPLMRDRVDAVSAGGDKLMLELRQSGSVPYASIKAFN